MKADWSVQPERREDDVLFIVCVGINQIWKSIIPIFPSGPPPFTRKRIDLSRGGRSVGGSNGNGGGGGGGGDGRMEDENHRWVLLVAIIVTRIGGNTTQQPQHQHQHQHQHQQQELQYWQRWLYSLHPTCT
ncbi:hypothetical protein V1478_009237, partial [Vespula squamosa]